jgi:DNA polymerase-3 subunit epsilon
MRIVDFIDLETTGLSQAKGHRIIEIGMIIADLDTEKELGRYVRRLNPGRKIDPKAQAVHGISLEDLKDEPKWEDIAPQVNRIINQSHLLVAHNMDFDGSFIVGELLRVGIDPPDIASVCTMEEGRWATPIGKLPTLYELCFAVGVEYDHEQAHGAIYDVEVMMAAFFQARRLGHYQIKEESE